ncbi:non-ribosomal peptide synthase domain TIGR01720/amino acid adenylation domain-containing protein [Amycolatopsis xylanica]|uniref:Non-ribosomal peptide synthase domain TIGR01720/amino acid adenylation domain-containing protein n=1 Tax=Amycolatopsis xylanica TaxID=589385 RepID=A0A1H2THB8_9PSEU|nr:non-ribosomal peptide synthetase [Amycolatopsis xylanica]SDW43366.1 non-ribosomal peptide synthase domain TIGR01720/amino acid adenylation domain-containing protein [Amycolatopsis xylanica]
MSAVEDVLPLSPLQQGMVFHALFGDHDVYTVQAVFGLDGPLDAGRLREAAGALLRRHPNLRSAFRASASGQQVQVIRRDVELPWREREIRTEEEFDAFLGGDRAEPFDITRPPLLRFTLVRGVRDRLVLTSHHLLWDGWSAPILVRELLALYAGEPLAPVRPYRDYLAWLARQDRAAAEKAWARALDGLDGPTLIAPDPKPGLPASAGFTLPRDVTARLAEVARAHGLTVNAVVQGVWSVVLGVLTGREDVVFGATVSGRDPRIPGVDSMVGLFITTLPVRVRLDPAEPLATLFGRVQAEQAALLDHQHLGLADIQRAAGHATLFDTLVVFESYPVGELPEAHGLRLAEVTVRDATHYPLALIVLPGEELGLRVDHQEGIDAPAIAARFERVLRRFLAEPALPLAKLGLLGADERAHELGAAVPLPETTLPELFSAQVARTPDATALVFDDQSLTYAELDARADALARRLAARGVRPETTVGIQLERSLDLVIALLAVHKAGGAYVPLDPSYPAERLGFMIADAAPAVVLTTLDDDSAEGELEPPRPGNPAYVIYTSGSTGRPKGVVVDHAAIVNRLLWMQDEFRLGPDDRVLQKTPSSFDVSVWEFFWPLITGATLVVAKPGGHKDPAYLASVIENERITTVHFVPSMLAEFLRGPAARGGLRRIICSGEALSADLRDRVRDKLGVPLFNLYGPTEAAVDVTAWACADEDTVPIGRPVWNTGVYVLDRFLRPVPEGSVGELYLGGVQLARGYLGRRDLTSSRFVANPFGEPGSRLYRTGDLVRFTAHGLEYLGRADDQVKLRGFRVELGEVEAALTALDGVSAAAAVVRPEQQSLVAYLTPETADPVAARAELSRVLPEHLVPSAFVVLDRFPLSPSGKLDRKALPEPEFVTSDGEAKTPAEEILCGLFADVLGAASVGVHDDFFAIGGHSILATRLAGRIRTALGVDVPVRTVFDAPTVTRLARALDGGPVRPAPAPRQRPAELPLSPAQRSLWFLDRLEGPSSAYNLPFTARLSGDVNVAALRAALSDVAGRHESLRTIFPETDGNPVQRILETASPELVQRTGSDVAAATGYEFRLAEEIPFRAELLTVGEREHVLVLLAHHIAGDEWSARPLLRDLAHAYAARRAGVEPSWRPLPLQYADFTLWQQELLAEVGETQRAYWAKRLEGVPEELPVPADRPRPAVPSHVGAMVTTRFDAAAVRKLARARGVSELMVTQAAVAVLLHRLGAGDDIPLGTPAAGRADEALDDLVGYFVNTLVLRTDLTGNPSFRELLARVRETNLGAYSHADLPFERVVETVNPPRSAARHPLFQVMVSHRDPAALGLELDGVTATPLPAENQSAKFDLSFEFGETEWTLVYSTDLYDRATAEAMADRFTRLLAALIADPARPVGLIGVLSEAERAQQRAWNDTAAAVPVTTLTAMVEDQVARTPGEPAVVFHDASLTYAQLNAHANRLARKLVGLGVGPERTVGMHWERSIEMIVGLLAIEKAGGAFVPLEPSWPAARIAEVCESAALAVVLSGKEHSDPVDGLGVPVVHVELAEVSEADSANLGVEIEPEGLSYVIYTSGSTGTPKGAMIRHRAITHRLLWQRELLGFGTGDAALFKAPLGFDISINEIFLPLVTGGAVVIAEPDGERDIDYLLGLIERHRVTFTYLPSSILDLLVGLDGFERRGRSLKHVWCGGEVLTPELFHRFRATSDAVMYHGYGPAEATIGVSHVVYRSDAVRSAISIGGPNGNTWLVVLDRNLQPVPAGVPGELYAGGVYLGRGYVNDPKRTAAAFVADPFGPPGSRLYRTGDLARWAGDGTLEFLGRADNQVKIRGMRVELEEIEAVLEQHDKIRRAVVLVREDQPGVKRLVGYALATGTSSEEVRSWLKGRLPEHMVPSTFVFLTEFPLMPSGKVNRRALPAPEPERRDTGRAPANERERVLCALMAEVLKIDTAGPDDNFFALGGDSILSIQWVGKARAAGVPISPRQVFEHQTVAALALAAGPEVSVEPEADDEGDIPLTPILRWWARTAEPGMHQSALLRIPPGEQVESALQAVLDTHEVLRARFTGDALRTRPVPVSDVLDRVVVTAGEDLRELVSKHYADAVGRLDPHAGEMVRAVWFDLGPDRPGRLLLVLHHLVVDGVSWRILAADLADAWAGRPLAAPATSFRRWARELLATVKPDASRWKFDKPGTPLGARPIDDRDTLGTLEKLTVTLPPAQAKPLLTTVPASVRAGVQDVLLTALAFALPAGTLVALEGHGREDHLVPGADLSRTVGWFTTVYPVALDVAGADPAAALKRVKEQLRAIPDNGIGFGLLGLTAPEPPVCFNYLGRFDMGAADGFWVPAEESDVLTGVLKSTEDTPVRYGLDVTVVTEDRADGPAIKVTWAWPSGVLTKPEVEAISASWVRTLDALATRTGPGGFTPSDVPLVSVNQGQLDKIAAKWRKK